MNYGPLIFLAAFFALASSWFGFVLTPQIQLGREHQSTNSVNAAELYPQARPGLARQGLDVYRANGCASCHSQQVRQTGVVCHVRLTDIGTNAVRVAEALVNANVGVTRASPPSLAAQLPKRVTGELPIAEAVAAVTALNAAGAKAEVEIVPTGPDIARGWGPRRTVAQDFLFDDPVLPGSQRVGPDLANVGSRWPENWQLIHLYDPRAVVTDSVMPPYRFLFERRRITGRPSPDALRLEGKFAPGADYEIVPKPEARALVAYLASLRAATPLFETPMFVESAPPTNSPAK